MSSRRNRRAGVEDRWYKTVRNADGAEHKVPSANHGKGKRWRARYVDDTGQEHAQGFERKVDAQQWLNAQTSALQQGTHVAPKDAQRTVAEWCDEWIEGYKVHRKATVDLAEANIRRIKAEFGPMQLSAIRPSMVKAWCAKLKAEKLEESYVYALHNRLSQILGDAVSDGLLARNPCSRKTSPPAGKQKVYVATTDQVWQLHDAVPVHIRAAILLGAFAGLRVAEVSALRVADVDFTRGIVHPKQQWPDRPLKTAASDAPVPIPQQLALLLAAAVKQFPGEHVVSDEFGKPVSPWMIGWHLRQVKGAVPSLPDEFSYHDLRHFYASLLISKGADVKLVQARLRHGSATTTLRTYVHLWPDADTTTRTAIGDVIAARLESTADGLRTADAEIR